MPSSNEDTINKLLDGFYRQNQRELTRMQAKGEREIAVIYANAMASIRKALKDLYDKFGKDGKLDNKDKTVYMMLRKIEKKAERYLNAKNLEIDSLIDTLTEEQYSESFFRMAYSIENSTGIAIEWGVLPEKAIEEAVLSPLKELRNGKFFKTTRDKAIQRIREDLALALIRGDSFEVLSRRIGTVLGVDEKGGRYYYSKKGLASRAMTIARTEGMRALNKGHQNAYGIARDNGCDIEEVWDATLDTKTRPSHGLLDGQAKDHEHDGWYVPELGAYVKGPLQSNVASFDINCRCRTTAKVKGTEDTERRIKGEGIQKYRTYSQWKLGQELLHPPITTKDGIKITKISFHSLERFMERGLSKEDIVYTLANPREIIDKGLDAQGRHGIQYNSDLATICINPATNTITTGWRKRRRR